MKKWLGKTYKDNKAIVWAAVVSLILIGVILLRVPDEVTRFTLIMPVFAGFILFSILITSDEELEEEGDVLAKSEVKAEEKKKPSKPKKSRKK